MLHVKNQKLGRGRGGGGEGARSLGSLRGEEGGGKGARKVATWGCRVRGGGVGRIGVCLRNRSRFKGEDGKT